MRKPTLLLALIFTLPLVRVSAQDSSTANAPKRFYHLVYAIQEVGEDGKVTNSRAFATNIATDGNFVEIRSGDKLPLRTDDKGTMQYLDIGVNIDSGRAEEVNGKLALKVNADVSSTAPGSTEMSGSPVIRQNKMTAVVLIPLGKPTVIFSSDDLRDKGKLQVELTATRVE